MIVRTKKQNSDGIFRLETSGELKEIFVNEDLLDSGAATISLCFRGENSAGIIELTKKEIDILNEEIAKKLLGKVKVRKFSL